MWNIIGQILALIIFEEIHMIIHELGHAIVAKRNGVTVEEFGIGFPPKAWGKKVKNSFLGKDVVYSVNWLPLGGFVKLQGEHDQDDGKNHYDQASGHLGRTDRQGELADRKSAPRGVFGGGPGRV